MTRKTIEDDRTNMTPAPKTERRNSGQSESQRFASIENFALFTLRGIQTHINNSRIKDLLSPAAITTICHVCEQEIDRIKTAQELRKESKCR